MRRGEFLAKITLLGGSLAAATRAVSKLTGLPAERILEDVTTEARACLMRWRWKSPSTETWGPQADQPKTRPATPTTLESTKKDGATSEKPEETEDTTHNRNARRQSRRCAR